MGQRRQYLLAGAGVWAAFLLVQFGALALAAPAAATGIEVGGDPADPRIGVGFVVGLLLATAVIYGAFHFGFQGVIRGLIFVVSIGLTWFVFAVAIPPVVTVAGVNVLAAAAALGLAAATFALDRWWLLDAQAIVLGIGIVTLFGISLEVLPILVLLVLLAVYDAISVYGTKHMVTLAEDAVSSRLPVLLVVPLGRDEPALDPGDEDGPTEPWGNAVYIGLGDAAIPSILAVSAAVHAPVDTFMVAGLALTLPAIGTIVGIGLGLAALLTLTARGRAHAGLPLLNTGAIGGYLVGAVIAGIDPAEAVGIAGYL